MNNQQQEILNIIMDRAMRFGPAVNRLVAREDRSFGRGMIAGALITAFVGIVISLGIFFSYQAAHASPPKDTIEQQLNDTLKVNSRADHALITPHIDGIVNSEKITSYRRSIWLPDKDRYVSYDRLTWSDSGAVLFFQGKEIAFKKKGRPWVVLDSTGFQNAKRWLIGQKEDSL